MPSAIIFSQALPEYLFCFWAAVAADGLHVLEGLEPGVVVVAHAALLVVDDVGEARHAVGDREHLVDLLLVLDDRELRAGMREHEAHLVGDRVLIDRHRNSAERLHRAECPIEAGAIAADDGDLVAANQA